MKKFYRWPRIVFALVNIFIIFWLLTLVRKEYVLINTSNMSNNDRGGIVFGLSLVEEKPQTLLSNLREGGDKNDDWSTSFLLQSQSPTAQVFLDYISVYGNVSEPQYCFTSFHLGKNINVPFQVISELGSSTTIPGFGKLENINDESDEYVFKLDNQPCFEQGKKYFVPHLFLGIITAESSANLLIDTITGYKAFDFFPFDEQKFTFDISAHYIIGNDNFVISPNLDISISQPGWIGNFNEADGKVTLNLTRPTFYRAVLIVFSVIMIILIPLLNNIIEVEDGFFEVAFGLLLGLWGTHEILIPSYVETSIPIDIIIYIMYVLLLFEIVAVVIDEYLLHGIRQKIKIADVVKGDLDSERVTIENPTLLPIDMTNWILFDRAMNKFKFPVFTLGGRKKVEIWTKEKDEDEDKKKKEKTSTKEEKNIPKQLYWGRKREVWNNKEDTVFLEDSKGHAIGNYSYESKSDANVNPSALSKNSKRQRKKDSK